MIKMKKYLSNWKVLLLVFVATSIFIVNRIWRLFDMPMDNRPVKVFILSGQSNCNGNTPRNKIPAEMNKVFPDISVWIAETNEDFEGKPPRHDVCSWRQLQPGYGYNADTLSGPELSMGYGLQQKYQ